ncbi:MAG: ketoacyl-ACP synthase III [Candidatus Melainabacteria bacterium]|nr:ketoacyl-ACP synthase III [Candidatus Melainabacteria bacterium]MBI3308367.1 ketoacyl-ACP synthase III [Candidatus Melainabacteria bacterium]
MQKNYGIKFIGIGTALPSKVVKNTDLEKLYDTTDEWIYQRTGIRERRVVEEGKESGFSLSTQAAKKALSMSGVSPADLDLIIVATATPDNLYPSMSCLLQGALGANSAIAYDLSAACSGFVYAVITAAQFIYCGTYKNILVVGLDIHSRFMDWSDRSVSILFGDGAGAVVLQSTLAASDEILGYSMQSQADSKSDLVLTNHNIFYPARNVKISPNFTKMNGKAIFEFGLKIIPETINKTLAPTSLKISDFDYLIPHQANKRIIDSAAKKLGFPNEKVISNIEKVGNTSAASIPLALKDAMDTKKIKVPCKMLWVGFGAGLTWGTVAVNWNLKL